jgi:hypothetical protein
MSRHLYNVGQPVEVYRSGVFQRLGVIVRLDRNVSYRVEEFEPGQGSAFCNSFEDELVPIVGS